MVCYRVKSHCSIERKVMIGLIDPKVIIKFPLTSKKEEKIYKADLSHHEKFLWLQWKLESFNSKIIFLRM